MVKTIGVVVSQVVKHEILIICLCLLLSLLNFFVNFECVDQQFFGLFFALALDNVINQLFLLDTNLGIHNFQGGELGQFGVLEHVEGVGLNNINNFVAGFFLAYSALLLVNLDDSLTGGHINSDILGNGF